MAKVLLRVSPSQPDEHGLEIFFEGARRSSYGIYTKKIDEPTGSAQDFEFFLVDEVDIDVALSDLTRTFPGRDVSVYRTEKSAIRPAGDLVIKNVTASGVLP